MEYLSGIRKIGDLQKTKYYIKNKKLASYNSLLKLSQLKAKKSINS